MGFYFCGKYIDTNGDKVVEKDMHAALPYFQVFDDQDMHEK